MTPWIIPSLVGVVTSLLTALYAWRRVRRPANVYLCLLALAAAWVCLFQAIIHTVPSHQELRLWLAKFQYLGYVSGPVFWLLTGLAYQGAQRLIRRSAWFLWLVPGITVILVFTNEFHHLIWQRFEVSPGVPGLDVNWGIWFTVHAVYCYSTIFIGTLLLAHCFSRSRQYVLQLLAVIFAPLSVLALNFNYLLGFDPLPIDPTPLGIAVGALLLAMATRSHLLAVAPVAHRETLDSLSEGVIVTTDEGRIVDSNRAARELLHMEASGIGRLLADWLPGAGTQDVHGRFLEVRNTPIRSRNIDGNGSVYVIRDITEERAAKHRLMAAQRELSELNTRLDTMAHTDSLTGLLNRRSLNESLAVEWSRAVRHGRNLSILLIDLDHFKRINDTYGHVTGDTVLAQTGKAVMQLVRPEDMAVRYGGEEVAVLLPETDVYTAIDVARRIHSGINALSFHHDSLGPFGITASIGIASKEDSDTSAERLIARADAALYHVKRNGRDGIGLSTHGRREIIDDPMQPLIGLEEASSRPEKSERTEEQP